MISYVLFALSAACFAAMFTPRKPPKPVVKQDYSYYVCDPESLPTWSRKAAPMARVASRRA